MHKNHVGQTLDFDFEAPPSTFYARTPQIPAGQTEKVVSASLYILNTSLPVSIFSPTAADRPRPDGESWNVVEPNYFSRGKYRASSPRRFSAPNLAS